MKYYVVSSLVIYLFSAAPPPLSQTDYITIGIVVGAVSFRTSVSFDNWLMLHQEMEKEEVQKNFHTEQNQVRQCYKYECREALIRT